MENSTATQPLVSSTLTTKASEELEESVQNDLGVSDPLPADNNTIAHLLEIATSGTFLNEKE